MMFSPRNGSSPQKNQRGVGTAAHTTLVAEEFTSVPSSATQARGVVQIIREPHAVLLELIHRFTDSWQQLMILNTLTNVFNNGTHDSRRHGQVGIMNQFRKSRRQGSYQIGDVFHTSDNLGDRISARSGHATSLMTCQRSWVPAMGRVSRSKVTTPFGTIGYEDFGGALVELHIWSSSQWPRVDGGRIRG
jgi:hypothetical protein